MTERGTQSGSGNPLTLDQARAMLGEGPSTTKLERRRRYLDRHPDRRLQVNTVRLRAIIDYEDFICHPMSSVARGEAIRHSDIDLGVVVLRERLEPEEQRIRELDFVRELRAQGFDVYHESEFEEISERYHAAREEEKGELTKIVRRMSHQTIVFHTGTELSVMRQENPPQISGLIALGGTSIPSWPPETANS